MWLFLANDWRVEKAGGDSMSCISFLFDSPYPFSSGVKSNIPNGTASVSLSLDAEPYAKYSAQLRNTSF